MSLKASLEKHLVWFALSMIVVGTGGGWIVSENTRVTPRTEKIADLEKRNSDLVLNVKDSTAAVEPYAREVAKLQDSAKQLQSQLFETQNTLEQWKSSHETWRVSTTSLKNTVNTYVANCNISRQLGELERKKESVESDLGYALNNGSEASKQRTQDYRRIVEEYQARLLQLQSKLSCPQGN